MSFLLPCFWPKPMLYQSPDKDKFDVGIPDTKTNNTTYSPRESQNSCDLKRKKKAKTKPQLILTIRGSKKEITRLARLSPLWMIKGESRIYKYSESTQKSLFSILNEFNITLHGLTSWTASLRTICLWQGAQLLLISMETDVLAFLCCGCDPALALVYVC